MCLFDNIMNGFTQLTDQIVTNSYLNIENNYSLNDSNVYSICESVGQQLAFDDWNTNKDYQHLHESQSHDDELLSNELNEQQFNIWNQFSSNNTNIDSNNSIAISNNSVNNHILINQSLSIQTNVNNCDNYLNFNNNNENNSNISDSTNKQLVKKVNNKLTTNKKLSRKESTTSSRHPKPVSAYALFFRDAQSAIKSSNPNASFGEISKVVASNWEALDKSTKNIYKQRADQEKKNYLKSLASSRAKQIAGLMEQSSKPDFDALPQSSGSEINTDSVPVVLSDNNNLQINTTTTYDSTQESSNTSHGMGANESAFIENNEQLQQNTITSTENNTTGIAKQHCIRSGCSNDAIDSSEWDNEYCSSECCVKHCSDVFQAWVEKQQFATNNG